MLNGIKFMVFCGVASIFFLLLSKASKAFNASEKKGNIATYILLAIVVVIFVVIFDIKGLPAPADLSERARRP
ncbi:MAG TPA: hypothetical protein VLA61_20640 [Ideonella sp.]|uniref:hypothetical protein n=1 Tax=Ideonella sp. TaxID=1929293 RepID=UPI002C34B966|nr:hypothetical protein [Ideonella sp.]HSI50684.1 hypothetical protein [Ideonella sp.]